MEYRSLPILLVYLTTCASLTAFLASSIYQRAKSQSRHAFSRDSSARTTARTRSIFILLSLLSLYATWSYMLAFFAWSYRNWQLTSTNAPKPEDPTNSFMNLELWLRDTKLFKQAWETVVETPARAWWSGQIFWFATGWSLLLGVLGRRYEIRHMWAYMLLGQIVAISFAMNLFFLAVVVSTPPSLSTTTDTESESKSKSKPKEERLIWTPPITTELTPLLSLLAAATANNHAHTPTFLATLLIPHILLFIPTILHRGLLSGFLSSWGSDVHVDVAARRYARVLKMVVGVCVALQVRATFAVLEGDGDVLLWVWRLLGTMREHPAVGSVSWDVVFSTVSSVVWGLVSEWDMRVMLGCDRVGFGRKNK